MLLALSATVASLVTASAAHAEDIDGSSATAVGAAVGALVGATVGVGLVLGTAERVQASEASPALVWTGVIIGSTSLGVMLGALVGGTVVGDPLTGVLAGVGAGLATAMVSSTLALISGSLLLGASALLLALPGLATVNDSLRPVLAGPLVASLQALSFTPVAVGYLSASLLECAVAERCDAAATSLQHTVGAQPTRHDTSVQVVKGTPRPVVDAPAN